ncbi:MAG: hypothetical protein ABW168_23505 [Sedimenticola sp.]
MSKNKSKIRKLEARIEELTEELNASKLDQESMDSELDEKPPITKHKNMPEIKAPIFRGTDTEDFAAWLRNYERVAEINNWSKEFCIKHISTVLQDEANSRYWDCSLDERLVWELLIPALQRKFSPESNRATFEAALETRTQLPSESLDKYMSELKILSKKAYPDWEDKYRDKLVTKYFTDGIDEHLRIWVLQSNPKNADEALQAALRSNANLQRKASVKEKDSAKTGSAMVGATQTSETSNLAEAIAIALERRGIGNNNASTNRQDSGGYRGYNTGYRGRGRGYRGRDRRQAPRGNCHACGQQGHFWRDAVCPKSPMFQQNGLAGNE